jgi:hypothetical protein
MAGNPFSENISTYRLFTISPGKKIRFSYTSASGAVCAAGAAGLPLLRMEIKLPAAGSEAGAIICLDMFSQ